MSRLIEIDQIPVRPVDPSSPVPLYHQIEVDLRRLIQTGQLVPDDLLPPETELCRVYGVGRQTMRMALGRLVDDHLIARRAGQGTFIKQQSDRTQFYLDRSFTRQMADMGLEAHSRLLESTSGIITPDCASALRSKIGAPYFYLARLRFGGKEAVGLQYSTVLTERCLNLEKHDFDKQSLYDILSMEYHLVIRQIDHAVSAVIADGQQAKLLRIKVGDPLLLVKTNAYLDDQQIIEYTVSYYRADKYEYHTTHTNLK